MTSKPTSILMFFPWIGNHPQDAFAGVQGAAAARHWEFFSADTARAEDGSMQLDEGLKKFKKEGVDAIVNAVNGDLKALKDRLKAMQTVSENYKSFSGISDDMDGKVDFIIKTDSIQPDKAKDE